MAAVSKIKKGFHESLLFLQRYTNILFELVRDPTASQGDPDKGDNIAQYFYFIN